MEKRVQSPSSINTYKQCPRKYYYNYIEELESKPNVHQVRGNIAHSALEHFFDIDTSVISLDNYEKHLRLAMQRILLNEWKEYKDKWDSLELSQEKEIHYFEDTLMMLLKWLDLFCKRLAKKEGTFQERFTMLTPKREMMYVSEQHHVRGIIDAIEEHDGTVRLMDYKTSSSYDLNKHILQLGIYSLLYLEKHGHMPAQVGVYFLKDQEKVMDVDEQLLEMAKKEIQAIHLNTTSRHIDDYPRKPSGLCKWSTGQCDFYDTCKPFG